MTQEQLDALETVEESVSPEVTQVPKKGMESADAVLYSRTASYKRGSWLMWTKDSAWFQYDKTSRIRAISPYQDAGYVFPNTARNNGWTHYYNTATVDRLRYKNTLGAGVVTPWGDVNVYESSVNHYLKITYMGGYSWSG